MSLSLLELFILGTLCSCFKCILPSSPPTWIETLLTKSSVFFICHLVPLLDSFIHQKHAPSFHPVTSLLLCLPFKLIPSPPSNLYSLIFFFISLYFLKLDCGFCHCPTSLLSIFTKATRANEVFKLIIEVVGPKSLTLVTSVRYGTGSKTVTLHFTVELFENMLTGSP